MRPKTRSAERIEGGKGGKYWRGLGSVGGRRRAREGVGGGVVERGEGVVAVWVVVGRHREERKRGRRARRLLLERIDWICPHVGKRV